MSYFPDSERVLAARHKTDDEPRHGHRLDTVERLASGVAHDMTELLRVIRSHAVMLEDAADSAAMRIEHATQIRRAVDRALQVARQLLAPNEPVLGTSFDAAPVPILRDPDVRPHRAARPSWGPAPRARLLLVDDDDQLRSTVARVLRRSEFEVTEADSGRAAMSQLESSRFDVILSDVHMPDGSGLDLLRVVRRFDLDVPVVLISGMPDVATATAAIEYGAFRFLVKPVEADTLITVARHASRAHALARIRREALAITGSEAGAVDRAGLEVRFEVALDQLWMARQPIVDATTGALFGIEALMRSDEASMTSPAALLDAAMQLGALPQLGRRVREVAAAAAASLCTGDVCLFVNLHPDDLLDPELIDESAPLTQFASRVILEVTERASLTASRELTMRLARLRKLGYRIAVDDIGAGYSGLASFTELQPELVKLDMSLVRDVHHSALKQRTIRALCKLCHEVNCLVVGEGVETQTERDCLVDLGCDLLQGYLIGRPARELPRDS